MAATPPVAAPLPPGSTDHRAATPPAPCRAAPPAEPRHRAALEPSAIAALYLLRAVLASPCSVANKQCDLAFLLAEPRAPAPRRPPSPTSAAPPCRAEPVMLCSASTSPKPRVTTSPSQHSTTATRSSSSSSVRAGHHLALLCSDRTSPSSPGADGEPSKLNLLPFFLSRRRSCLRPAFVPRALTVAGLRLLHLRSATTARTPRPPPCR